MHCYRFLVTSLDTAAYKFVFEALYEVPDVQDDDSLPILTPIWIFLLTDFGYYWFHRAAHGKKPQNLHLLFKCCK